MARSRDYGREMMADRLGFIGLGTMGSGMARNLLTGGFPLVVYDKDPRKVAEAVHLGAEVAESTTQIARACAIVHTCLHGDVMLELHRDEILPAARTGQIVVDHSTLGAPDARRLSVDYAERGAFYLDAPISGGGPGARQGNLRVFVGGDRIAYQKVLPMLHAIGEPRKVIYGGPSGQGQGMKVMQQLQMRLLNMARLEIVAFGRSQGYTFEEIARILDVDPIGDDPFARVIRGVQDGHVDIHTCLFPEWKYYLAEAHEKGIPMPMLEGAWDYFKGGNRDHVDVVGRPSVSLWQELTRPTKP
jgi:3-hydroxyisobutyrate dehydrogenase-like beta-hydroxyacid dehydrogenase